MDVSVPSKNRPPSRCNHVVMVSNLGSNLFNGYFFFFPFNLLLAPQCDKLHSGGSDTKDLFLLLLFSPSMILKKKVDYK